jgi:hypothetical protein
LFLASPAVRPQFVSDRVTYRWRGPLTDAEMVELVNHAFVIDTKTHGAHQRKA